MISIFLSGKFQFVKYDATAFVEMSGEDFLVSGLLYEVIFFALKSNLNCVVFNS